MSARREISLATAAAPLVVLFGLIAASAATVGLDGALLLVSMLVAAAVAGAIAVARGATWEAIQRSTGEKFAAVLPVVLILLAIGLLVGTWVFSGTIPLLVFWGVRLIAPGAFLVTAFVTTGAMSLATGTSWGSAGTLGVALMGAAAALGVPLPAAAGAVVSGAYLGDKMSPLSDTTNICALAAGANLYDHIRHMLWSAVPSTLVALTVYSFAGGALGSAGEALPAEAVRLLADLESVFRLDGWALLPLLVVLAGLLARRPPALVLAASSLVALAVGVAVQGFDFAQGIAAGVSGFDSAMAASKGLDPAALGPLFHRLVVRGGLESMAPTLVVILAAFLLAAGMDVSGALDRLLGALLARVRGTFGLVAATMASGATMVALTSHAGVTALVVGGMFAPAFAERKLAPQNLSRSLEDSVTVVEPLLPWTVSAIYMATTLGVPTLDYLPWALFCCGGPCFSLLIAATYRWTGRGIRRLGD
ncbi:MAG: Na+/H+ antiporter NhaC [Holophagales bacterium]|nr:Na+/H+ antiporter NhaC [Holophagales bacterium]